MTDWTTEFITTLTDPWALLGFSAQLLFFSRWIFQWWVSEKMAESYVPSTFWYISLAGGLMLLVYAVRETQPVFVLGQLIGVANYSRNIMLMRNKRNDPT